MNGPYWCLVLLRRLLRLQLFNGLTRGQILAGQAGIVRAVSVGAEDRLPALQTAEAGQTTWSLPWPSGAEASGATTSCHLLHLLDTLLLRRVQDLGELVVDALLEGRHPLRVDPSQFQLRIGSMSAAARSGHSGTRLHSRPRHRAAGSTIVPNSCLILHDLWERS